MKLPRKLVIGGLVVAAIGVALGIAPRASDAATPPNPGAAARAHASLRRELPGLEINAPAAAIGIGGPSTVYVVPSMRSVSTAPSGRVQDVEPSGAQLPERPLVAPRQRRRKE